MKQSRRILIVEDEKAILDVYRDILTPKGGRKNLAAKSSRSQKASPTEDNAVGATEDDKFELTLVQTGEEAVQEAEKAVAEKKPFAMGFFDVLLGRGIDGIEAVKRIHALDHDMYAVLVTAYQDRHVDSIRNLFGKEFQDRWDYLNKPFSEGEILQKARNMVSMWNLRKEAAEKNERLALMKKKLFDGEKSLTLAAVARSVGHEFGNILLQIMGRADLSRNGDEKNMRDALDTILIATEHASRVLERFKNLAKPHDSHDLSLMTLSAPIDEVLMLIDHELKRKKIDVVLEMNDLPSIQGNHTTLVQVFMNLMINSMYFMDGGGKIEIRGKVKNKNVELTFRDSGPGIPADKFDKIFEAFFTTKGDGGTGLGLAICKEIMEITHNGRISASNHPEGGAVFTLLFPLED